MHNTLALSIWPNESDNKILRNITLAVAGSALLAISAKISLPFYPVPMTLQTLVVLALGMIYGWKLGGATILLYLAEGAFGMPVFSGTPEKGMGLVYMMGGTGGYLFGFFLAATLTGYLAERGWDRNTVTTAFAMLFGNIMIYIPGLLWLGTLYGWDKPIFEWGLIPFIFADIVKLVIAAAVMPMCWRAVNKSTKRMPD